MARRLLLLLVQAFTPEGPVIIGLDDTLERRWGAKIKARGIYRDPVRSSHGHFVKASELDPFNATLRKTLILQLIQIKDYVNAKIEMEDYVKRFPQDAFMRQMLARAQGAGRSQ